MSASATTYYVRTDGLDAHAGTTNTAGGAWLTIQHAAATALAGDTVNVNDGTYVETVNFNAHNGTAGSRIVFKSINKWGALIAPTDTSGNSGRSINFAASYITLQDFDITATSISGAAIKLDSGSNNWILGNNIHGVGVSSTTCTSGAGVLVASGSHIIDHNRIWNVGPLRTASFRCNQQHGIYLTDLSNNTVTQNNIIFNIWQGFGIQLNASNLSNLTVSNNTIFNSGDTGHNSGGPLIFSCDAGTCDNNTFNNNIFANTQAGICIWEDGEYVGIFGTHNVYQNNVTYNCGSNIFVNGSAVNSTTSNPQFVNYTGDGAGDYHLSSTSPAIDTGTSVGAPATDFDGTTRPRGAGYDRGALEFIPASSPSLISYVQSATSTTTGTSPTLAFASNLGLNNSTFVTVGLTSATATVTSITDTQGLSYSNIIGPITMSGERVYIWFANITQAAADTVTVNLSANVTAHITVAEYSSSGSSFAVDKTASGTGTSTAAATAAATTTVANELLLAVADTATAPANPIAFVRQATGNISTGTSLPITIVAPGAGDALILTYASHVNGIASIAGGGVTWVQAVRSCAQQCNEIWYGLNSSGSGTTVTATLSASGDGEANVSEFSNVLSASALDQVGAFPTSGISTAPATPTITASANGELLIANTSSAAGTRSSGPTNGFTGLTEAANGNNRSNGAYLIQTTAAATSTGWTWSSSTGWDAAVVSFKPIVGGGTPAAGSSFVARRTGSTYLVEDDITTVITTIAGTATYSSSIPWTIAMATLYAVPNAPPPPPPPPVGPPPPPPSVIPSPCP